MYRLNWKYSQSCLQQTFHNTYTCWIWMVLYSSQSLSHVQLPFKIPGFYFSHETTTLITKSSQWPPVDSKHKSVRFRFMINAVWTPLHYQISDLRSLSHPTDPVISRSGMPSLLASTWPVRPPPLIIMCSGCLTHLAPDREVAKKEKKKRLREYMHSTIRPMVHLSLNFYEMCKD